QTALERYRALCHNLDCDFAEQDNFAYAVDDPQGLEREMEALSRLGTDAQFVTRVPLPIDTVGAVQFPHQAQFHPLKFAAAIAEDLPIHTHTKVLELGKGQAKTDHGTIRAEKIIIATHFPILNKHGAYFLKLYQHRSYVLALENAAAIDGMYVDEAKKGLSFRRCGDLLLLGGGSHRTGKKGGSWRELEDFAKAHYPTAKIVGRWATQDCMTLDGVPYVGQYAKSTPQLYVATGFNKWGMTSSMAAALVLTDLVQGRDNPYAQLFDPSRTMLRAQLALNAMESTVGLLTPTVPRCPHMGCALHYNRAEHSWDCACHGSRFSESGRVLNNPATDDKRM
ncbi:MAG: FAD-dependent oxidoreductase, partial [Oscillospiraceae bacterium]|nr:FAD-dependent oxidoreductase [Oscillospiraceae bacterium]